MSDSQAIIAPNRGQRGWAKWAAIIAIGVAVMPRVWPAVFIMS